MTKSIERFGEIKIYNINNMFITQSY